MNNSLVSEPEFNPEIQVVHDRIMTTSIDISRNFEKDHKNVLRDIQNLEIPEDFNRLNFEPVEYKDAKGEMRPMYLITRDGFTILAMGFTGKRAMEFKIKYIEAFNRMEEELKGQDLHSRIRDDRSAPEPLEWTLERERLRLEAMRLRTDRAMKLKKMVLEFREREIFGLAEARQAAFSAVRLLSEEDPSGPVPGANEPVPAADDPATLVALRRVLAQEQNPLAIIRKVGEPELESWLLDQGILPTRRTMGTLYRISRKIFDISHEINDRVLEEERRIPSLQETLEAAVKQFLEGDEGG